MKKTITITFRALLVSIMLLTNFAVFAQTAPGSDSLILYRGPAEDKYYTNKVSWHDESQVADLSYINDTLLRMKGRKFKHAELLDSTFTFLGTGDSDDRRFVEKCHCQPRSGDEITVLYVIPARKRNKFICEAYYYNKRNTDLKTYFTVKKGGVNGEYLIDGDNPNIEEYPIAGIKEVLVPKRFKIKDLFPPAGTPKPVADTTSRTPVVAKASKIIVSELPAMDTAQDAVFVPKNDTVLPIVAKPTTDSTNVTVPAPAKPIKPVVAKAPAKMANANNNVPKKEERIVFPSPLQMLNLRK